MTDRSWRMKLRSTHEKGKGRERSEEVIVTSGLALD
jgi:hypothetical protein